MQLKKLTALSAALLFAVPAAHAQTGTSGNTSSTALPVPSLAQLVDAASQNIAQTAAFDRLFLIKASQGNTAEVLTGRLAQQKAQNEDVRRLAEMLVTEHSLANTDLTGILQLRGVVLPQAVGVMHQATYDQLSRAKGRDFDALFLGAQVEAHENTITLYQTAIQNGGDPQARDYALRYLPRILAHTQQIYDLARRLNAPGIAERPLNPPAPPAAVISPTALNQATMNMGNHSTTGGTTGH